LNEIEYRESLLGHVLLQLSMERTGKENCFVC